MRAALLLATGLAVLPPQERAAAPATRADLARSYLRFEQALARHPERLSADAERLNRAFDRASLAFFTGAFASSCATLERLALEVEGCADAPLPRALANLRVAGLPPVVVQGAGASSLELRVAGLAAAAVEGAEAVEAAESLAALGDGAVALELRDASGAPRWSAPLRLDAAGSATVALPLAELALPPGRYRLVAAPSGALAVELAATTLTRASFDRARESLLESLAKVTAATPGLAQSLATCKARARLLTDTPSPLSSAQFLAEPLALLRSLHAEAAALRAGRDPYAQREGELWRVLQVGARELPLCTYAPAALAAPDAPPAPLLIALHGAGGDERMFIDGYGAGLLTRLADQHGFLVATPQSSLFAGDPRHVELLIDELARLHPVDRSRVYLVGHSMGAGATAQLARQVPELLAAAACLAGGSFVGDRPLPPTLLVVGAIDPIVPAAPLLRGARAAQARGAPLTIEEHADFGHTLLVTAELPRVVEWLLTHRRGGE
ncbi:MAG: hypothetical protein JNL90_20015 [Planctomycetes bacterium]|nr:hypothetical protein [Planctomycetota bacterium]